MNYKAVIISFFIIFFTCFSFSNHLNKRRNSFQFLETKKEDIKSKEKEEISLRSLTSKEAILWFNLSFFIASIFESIVGYLCDYIAKRKTFYDQACERLVLGHFLQEFKSCQCPEFSFVDFSKGYLKNFISKTLLVSIFCTFFVNRKKSFFWRWKNILLNLDLTLESAAFCLVETILNFYFKRFYLRQYNKLSLEHLIVEKSESLKKLPQEEQNKIIAMTKKRLKLLKKKEGKEKEIEEAEVEEIKEKKDKKKAKCCCFSSNKNDDENIIEDKDDNNNKKSCLSFFKLCGKNKEEQEEKENNMIEAQPENKGKCSCFSSFLKCFRSNDVKEPDQYEQEYNNIGESE